VSGERTREPSERRRREPEHNAVNEGIESPRGVAVTLRGVACRIVCVDDAVPHAASGGARPRHVYVADEIAHFRVGPHRFALVPDAVERANGAAAGPSSSSTRDWRALLTNRELQIVQLICMGLLTKQVADRLHLSEFTVRSYLKTIYCKLGVRSRGGMVYAYAQMFGVTPPAAVAAGDDDRG
jgi:DNA-binding NarL/FixJ family response regulator